MARDVCCSAASFRLYRTLRKRILFEWIGVSLNRAVVNRHVNELISSVNGVTYFMTHLAAVTLIRSCLV